MKEYTLIYKAEITEVITNDGMDLPAELDKENIEAWLEDKLNVDDAHVKDIKVFEREVAE